MINLSRIILLALLHSLCLFSTAQEDPKECPLRISPQSVECFYPEIPQENAVLCRLRLHITPIPGYVVRTRAEYAMPQEKLKARDGANNELEGAFREWELCYDSDENCVIAVYDFLKHPAGGVLHVDGVVDIPVSGELTEHEEKEFKVQEQTSIVVADHVFRLQPTPSDAEDEEHAVIHLEYTYSPDIADIRFCGKDGTPLPCQIVDGHFDAERKLARATCIIPSNGDTLIFRLLTYKNCNKVQVPVRFRAVIGR